VSVAIWLVSITMVETSVPSGMRAVALVVETRAGKICCLWLGFCEAALGAAGDADGSGQRNEKPHTREWRGFEIVA